jgi:hypothetical protein
MNTNATLEQIKGLKLQGMVRSYEATIQLPVNQHPEGHQLIAQLAEAEKQNRTQYKTQLFLKLSKLRYGLLTGANGSEHTTCAASNP